MTESIPISSLARHLAERTRAIDGVLQPGEGGVVYWMRVAVRGHENPALDVAMTMAQRLNVPLVVYHSLDERYPHASDRHHRFILEGARDVQSELAARGVSYAFHLRRPGHRDASLRGLAARASLVVTEEWPLEPLAGWAEALVPETTVWCVDTACLAPMRMLGRSYDRAFRFREAAQPLWNERIGLPWPDVEGKAPPAWSELPFEPLDLQTADLSELIAQCEIDHSVAPVPQVRGGSVAGYERWETFKREGLAKYASRRNDPLKDGTSRLSPYLHYGHVSPFRIAREAHSLRHRGAEKFLDELLVWREIAWNLCAFRDDPQAYDALPAWARTTLDAHLSDPRPQIYDEEQLAQSETGDALWDACQDSLRIHGSLHNNVRMTWGKALLQWAEEPREALRLAFQLNDRYALDGRDPGSVGGILWCFGALDRPFQPERPVSGSVRPRPTSQHATRMDIGAYARQCAKPAMDAAPRVAVVGAGIAGLAAARTLISHGLSVRLFDRGRAAAGRTASRPFGETSRVDHGAQYFTARDPRFARMVDIWERRGVVAEWPGAVAKVASGSVREIGRGGRRFVGVPRMSALARHLASGLDVMPSVTIEALVRDGDEWAVLDNTGVERGRFDQVILALPGPQAAPLLRVHQPAWADLLASAGKEPCFAVVASFDERLPLQFDGLLFEPSDGAAAVAWAARDSSKPGREEGERWVLHTAEPWSRAWLERDRDDLRDAALASFARQASIALPSVIESQVHRWGCARPATPLQGDGWFDEASGLGVAGDWFGASRVEDAWLSGVAVAGRMLGRGRPRESPSQPALFS